MTSSTKINEIKKQIPMISNTDSAVMICGETGTGKEMIAQSIHTRVCGAGLILFLKTAPLSRKICWKVFCLERKEEAFTGAEDKAGLFEIANGELLFLDEINSMELGMQAKILKAIEEKQIRRIGGNKSISFDVKSHKRSQ